MIFEHNFNSIAFDFLGINIRWYGLSYIMGIIIASIFIKKFIDKEINIESMYPFIIIGVVIGGRLGFVFLYMFEYYIKNPSEILQTWKGGMSFHGGLVGLIISTKIYSYIYKKNFLSLIDKISLATPIVIFFVRIANFINGELYGRLTNSNYGFIFKNTDGLPRHPSQLYESFLEGFVLFIILNIIYKKNKTPGIIAFYFCIFYCIFRIICEFFREPDYYSGIYFEFFTKGQLLSMTLIIIVIILKPFVIKYNK